MSKGQPLDKETTYSCMAFERGCTILCFGERWFLLTWYRSWEVKEDLLPGM